MERIHENIGITEQAPKNVFLRVSGNALKSRVISPVSALFSDFGASDIEIHQDARDRNVFYAALPLNREEGTASRLVNALNKQPYIDEAWDEKTLI